METSKAGPAIPAVDARWLIHPEQLMVVPPSSTQSMPDCRWQRIDQQQMFGITTGPPDRMTIVGRLDGGT